MTGPAALSPGQWVARLAMAVMPGTALLCAGAAGAATPALLVVAIVLMSLVWAAFPESAAGATVLSLVVLWWGVELGSALDPLVLPAGAALLTAHVASVLASYGPASMPLDPPVVRLWVRRAALVYLPAPVLYLLAAGVEGATVPAGVWYGGLAATFAAITAASMTLTVRADDPSTAAAGHAVPGAWEAGH